MTSDSLSALDTQKTTHTASFHGEGPFDRVLIAVDDETDPGVIETAAAVAAACGATIDALSVVRMSASVDHWDIVVERRETAAERALERVEALADPIPVRKRLRYGDPAEEIELYAEHNAADIVVVGAPERGRLRRFFTPKSVTESLRASVSLPVLAVPGSEPTDERRRRKPKQGRGRPTPSSHGRAVSADD